MTGRVGDQRQNRATDARRYALDIAWVWLFTVVINVA